MAKTTDVYALDQGSVEVGGQQDYTLPVKPKSNLDKYTLGDKELEWIRDEISASDKHVSAFREEAMKAFRFMANHQMSKEDESFLRLSGRPNNAFNTAQKYIRYVSGIERMSPEILIFQAEEEWDPQAMEDAERATRSAEWAIRGTDGAYERSRAFEDAIIAGMGWEDSWIDGTSEIREKYRERRVSPLETLWPECSEMNLDGVRWRGRERFMDKDDVIRKWPDADLHAAAYAKQPFDGRPEGKQEIKYTVPYVETENQSNQSGNRPPKKLKVLQFQWWDEEEGFIFQDPMEEGARSWLGKKDFLEYQKRLMLLFRQRIEGEEKAQKVFKQVFLLERRVKLAEPKVLPSGRFTLNCMATHWDEDERQWYGFMRVLMDPQRYANKFFNQLLEIMATQAKGGLDLEDSAIEPKHRKDLIENRSKPGSITFFADGAISGNKVREKIVGTLPQATVQIMEFCVASMENVTGLNASAQGTDTGDVPGVSMRHRQKSGLILMAKEFDALEKFRKDEGRIALSLLKVIADDRVISAGDSPYEPIVFKLERRIFERYYNIFLDDSEHDPTLQAWYSDRMMSMWPTLARSGHFVPSMLNYLGLPIRVREEMKQDIAKQEEERKQMMAMGIPIGGKGQPRDPNETKARINKLNAEAAAAFAKAEAATKGRAARDYRSVIQALAEAERVKIEHERLGMDRKDKHLGHTERTLGIAHGVAELFKGTPPKIERPRK